MLCPQLDSGVDESVALHSRDEQSVLVVSYAELKTCLQTTFSEVLSSAVVAKKHPSDNYS